MKDENPNPHEAALRSHLVELLRGGSAHTTIEEVIADWPEKLRGAHVAKFPHTAWQLLEHMRLAQFDILDFSRNAKYRHRQFPRDYWPQTDAPQTARDWDRSVEEFKMDLKSVEQLVKDPATDLFAKIRWGTGQTLLREALLVADHNAYHLGQLVVLRRALGAWHE